MSDLCELTWTRVTSLWVRVARVFVAFFSGLWKWQNCSRNNNTGVWKIRYITELECSNKYLCRNTIWTAKFFSQCLLLYRFHTSPKPVLQSRLFQAAANEDQGRVVGCSICHHCRGGRVFIVPQDKRLTECWEHQGLWFRRVYNRERGGQLHFRVSPFMGGVTSSK